MQFFNYVMRKVWLHQTRIGLSLYDVAGQGYLKESDLENYILELIPTLPQLDSLEKSFYSFYVCTAVRKFFFFLDPLRIGKVRIQDILACSFLDDLLEVSSYDFKITQAVFEIRGSQLVVLLTTRLNKLIVCTQNQIPKTFCAFLNLALETAFKT